MSKRVSSLARAGMSAKKTKFNPTFMPTRIATAEVAAAVDADPPLPKLIQEVNSYLAEPEKGGCIAYWMRMGDLRSELLTPIPVSLANHLPCPVTDNRALARASEEAENSGIPLIVLFVICQAEYLAHDRSPKRIDFMLRNLASLKVISHILGQTILISCGSLRSLLYTFHSTLPCTTTIVLFQVMSCPFFRHYVPVTCLQISNMKSMNSSAILQLASLQRRMASNLSLCTTSALLNQASCLPSKDSPTLYAYPNR